MEHNIGGPEDQGTHALKEHIGELVGRKQTHIPRYEVTSYLFVSRQMETKRENIDNTVTLPHNKHDL